ncbi:MAG: outer membrane beta-barrel protein [Acidobacteria bacterium]|nr:outer membrane beta-barrel protein [Acidobacteriota bacterium]
MKRTFFILALAILAMPLAAQDHTFSLSGFVTSLDPQGDGVFEGIDENSDLDDLDANFDSSEGFGAALGFHLSDNIALELAASVVEPEFILTTGGPVPITARTELEMIPVTLTLQWHLNPDGMLDPYIGAGAAYILFDDADDFDRDDTNLESVDIEDDVGLVVNAGLNVNFSEMIGLYLDAKYVPVEAAADAVFLAGDGTSTDIEINPLMFSGGLRLMF